MNTIPEEMTVPRFVGNGRIETARKPVPVPGPGQLLVKVRANALCGSERDQFYKGTPITPGHEMAGEVAAAGEGTSTAVGTPGVVFLMDFCGDCRSCRAGATNQCLAKRADMGFSHDGGYGPYALIHESIFFPTSDTLAPDEATLLLDIMGTGGHALARAGLVHADIGSVLVAGAGPIGLGIAAMAKLVLGHDIPVYIFDVSAYRLSLAEALGALPISVEGGATVDEGLRRYGAGRVDVALDTTGKQVARQAMLPTLAQRGALVLVGHGQGLLLSVSVDMIAPERAVLGSEYFAYSELAANRELLSAHRDYLGKIITHRFGVDEIQVAFETFFSGKAGKVIVTQ